MAARRHAISAAPSRLAQLWQFPLLVLSLGLFGYAAYLFIDPQPGMSLNDKVDVARLLLRNDRPEAARDHLNKLLQNEKLSIPQQGAVHAMLSEALFKEQKQKKISVPANYERIIEQARLADARGVAADAETHMRLAESYEALGRWDDAVDNYRKAMSFAPERALVLQRKIIDLQLTADDAAGASASLEKYLADQRIVDAERSWAVGQKAQLLIADGKFSEAKSLLENAMRIELDPVARGGLRYWMGYCAWKLGDSEEAERVLRVARDEMQIKHPLDADASYVLGKIFQDRNDPQQSNSFFQNVITGHPDAQIAPLARLGRALNRIMLAQDDAALTDLSQLVNEVLSRPSRAKFRGEVTEGVRLASAALANRENFTGALEALAYEQELEAKPNPSFFFRLANVYEKRSGQLQKQIELAPAADRIRREQQYRECLTKAADAYVAYSRAQTVSDDSNYASALWKGVDLYDRSGDTAAVISTLELFVAERPDDALAPDALLALGRAYQAAGNFDKAIQAFRKNQFRFPQTLAGSKSAVPLAQAYIAKGPDSFAAAEGVLRTVLDNNPIITPDSQEFKQALFELGQLLHRTNRFEDSVVRLEEFAQRYPNDERTGELLFLTAEGYRKSAEAIDPKVAATQPGDMASAADLPLVDPAEALNARRDRLNRAKSLYDRIIEMWRQRTPVAELDKQQLKYAYFYRADCSYDLADYREAIDLYEAAATRYQDDPIALTAFVQIVNTYCAMGNIEQAKAANARAKYVLLRMPAEAFANGGFAMPREYWERQLKWMGEAGMW